jgi:hypothetical protein
VYPGYLNVACVEIINNERTAAYAGAIGENGQCEGGTVPITCDRCPDLPMALGHDPYISPAMDDAPWYDPVRLASADFLGIMGGSIEGLTDATFTRTPVPLIGGGSAIGPLHREHREMAFTVTAIARSECGLSYGMEWLARALSADPCEQGCGGVEATMFACCPENLAGVTADDELRHFFNVGILDGPTVTERVWVNETTVWATVTFTLVAGNPYIFGEPLDTGDDWTSIAGGDDVQADPDDVFQKCLPPRPCAQDDACPRPPLPPAPPAPLSPCYVQGTAAFKVARIQVQAEEYPLWAELVPLVEVMPGSQDLRRLLVRFWFNPADAECGTEELDPCDSCGDVNVSFVPAGSTLTVDGRTQRSEIACETEFRGVARSAPDLYGAEGGLFTYPYFPCPGGLCVEVGAVRHGGRRRASTCTAHPASGCGLGGRARPVTAGTDPPRRPRRPVARHSASTGRD